MNVRQFLIRIFLGPSGPLTFASPFFSYRGVATIPVRQTIDILVADDSDQDVEITLYALRRVMAEPRIMRVKDGEQTLQFLFAAGGYAGRERGCRAAPLAGYANAGIGWPGSPRGATQSSNDARSSDRAVHLVRQSPLSWSEPRHSARATIGSSRTTFSSTARKSRTLCEPGFSRSQRYQVLRLG